MEVLLSRVPLFVIPWTVARPTGSSVHGILQARILERVAIPFFRGFSQPRDGTRVSVLQAASLPSEAPGKPNKH